MIKNNIEVKEKSLSLHNKDQGLFIQFLKNAYAHIKYYYPLTFPGTILAATAFYLLALSLLALNPFNLLLSLISLILGSINKHK